MSAGRKPEDENGFPGTTGELGEFDGGDTAAIIGTIIALEPNETRAQMYCQLSFRLTDGRGKPRRHYDVTKWYGQSDRFSRDQLIPMICAAIRFKHNWDLWLFYRAHSQNYFLIAWNRRKNGSMEAPKKVPDFTGPEIWALWIRYKEPWWGLALLWLLDGELLIGCIVWRFRRDRVTRNHMLSVITCRRYRPTIISRLAFAITDFDELIARWRDHCNAVREWQTADLFEAAVKELK